MKWDLEWAQFIPVLLKRQDTGETVQALESMPVLYPDLLWVYNGFMTLCGSRAISAAGSVCPIPMTEIEAWLRIHRIRSQEDRLEFLQLIQAMDSVYMEKANAKSTNANTKSSHR